MRLIKKCKKKFRKFQKFSKDYNDAVEDYFDEDRRQALRMKPDNSKVRF